MTTGPTDIPVLVPLDMGRQAHDPVPLVRYALPRTCRVLVSLSDNLHLVKASKSTANLLAAQLAG